jgi:hypothetical protein
MRYNVIALGPIATKKPAIANFRRQVLEPNLTYVLGYVRATLAQQCNTKPAKCGFGGLISGSFQNGNALAGLVRIFNTASHLAIDHLKSILNTVTTPRPFQSLLTSWLLGRHPQSHAQTLLAYQARS